MRGVLARRGVVALALAWPRLAWAETLTLEALMAVMARVPAGRARFVETRRFAAIEGTLESRGTLSYRPGFLEKVTDWPEAERLEVDGERVVLTAGNEAPRVIDMGMAPQLRVLIDAIRGPLNGDVAALRRVFVPAVTGAMEGWALTLVPRAGPGVLRSVRLEGHAGVVTRIAVVQGNGDSSVMVVTPIAVTAG